jgi:hypothetical protein
MATAVLCGQTAPFSIIHNDTSVANGTDTLSIQMIAQNQYGCSIPHFRTIFGFPAATADFDISDDILCDGDTISFTNNSSGYARLFLDLATELLQTIVFPADKPYFNFSNFDRIYLISLTTFRT